MIFMKIYRKKRHSDKEWLNKRSGKISTLKGKLLIEIAFLTLFSIEEQSKTKRQTTSLCRQKETPEVSG